MLLHALTRAGHGLPLRALHVCHYLQNEADDWAAHCRAFCARHEIAFERLDVSVETDGQGIEAAARHARYTALAGVVQPGELLALAHHADDQAETFLLQALRGAGVGGLAAMPGIADFHAGRLWRALLALPRAALRAYAAEKNLDWVEDPSNRDCAIDRGYLRETIWPALTERWPAAPSTLSRAAHWCAQASGALAQVAAEDTTRVADAHHRLAVASLTDLDDFRQAGVLRHWLAQGAHDPPDHRHIEQIRRLLTARHRASPVVRWAATEVRLFGGRLYAMPALPASPGVFDCDWALERPLPLPADCGVLRATFSGRAAANVRVVLRRGGERLPDDARISGSRALKSFLQNARVPPWVRRRLPLVYLSDRLVAVGDYWLDPAAAQRLGVRDLRIDWDEAPPR